MPLRITQNDFAWATVQIKIKIKINVSLQPIESLTSKI